MIVTAYSQWMMKQQAHLFYRAFIAESYLSIYPEQTAKGAYLKALAGDLLAGREV